jgi:hypothetical protein
MFAGCPGVVSKSFIGREECSLSRTSILGSSTLVLMFTYMAAMMAQLREMTKTCLNLPSQHSKKATPEQEVLVEKLRKEIESNQENTISLCTEKVLLAQQAYDLVRIKHLTLMVTKVSLMTLVLHLVVVYVVRANVKDFDLTGKLAICNPSQPTELDFS